MNQRKTLLGLIINFLRSLSITKETEPAVDVVVIFVEGHNIIALLDKLKVGQFLLIDSQDVFVMLLFFLLLELFCVELIVKFEKVEGLVVGGRWKQKLLGHGEKLDDYIN